MALLQVLKGLNPGQQFPLEGERIILGRHPECDIVLEVGAVSRQHAVIVREGPSYFVEDLKSRNGTYLNGKAVEGRAQLKENDRVKICDLLFTFHDDPPKPAKPATETSEYTASSATLALDDEMANSTATIMGTVNLTENASLRMSVKPETKLKAMLEITHNLAKAMSVDDVLPKVLESLFKVFSQADRGFILLQDAAAGTLVPKAVRHRRSEKDDTIRMSRSIINQVLKGREAILSADAVSDSRFDMSQSVADFRIRSMMCVPMFDSEGNPIGLVQVDTQEQQQRFEQDDLEVLASVAAQAAIAIENATLHEQLLSRQILDREMDFARKVQQGFLPSHPPEIPGYSFFDYYKPARQVGGDYFDYVLLPDGRLAIILADVSGKGVPAALLMAKLSSEVRYCLVSQPTPATAVEALNHAFCSDSWEDRFVTMVMFVCDLKTHRLTLVNAGHMPPLLRQPNGSVEEIDSETGLPLGVADGMEYGQYEFTLNPGESLTVYTDGFSEAMNANRDLYGLARLRDLLVKSKSSVTDQGQAILGDVRTFIGQVPQSDDMCIVCFGRNG